jgi:hypothetical protein
MDVHTTWEGDGGGVFIALKKLKKKMVGSTLTVKIK